MGKHREVEDKYDADPELVLPLLAEVTGVAAVGAPEEHDLEATYFDTADLRLVAAGITLRRRTGGTDDGWHLKLPGKGARTEIQEPLGSDAVPDRLRAVVRALVRDADLSPVAVLRTRRTTRNLLAEDDTVLAELADDVVCSHLPRAEGREQEWRELEVELVSGDQELLKAAGTHLVHAGARRSRSGSKLTRALGDHVPGARTIAPERTDDDAAVLVLARLSTQVEVVVNNDPLVRENLPESVHDMRVATRRLRSALATYRPFLDRMVSDPLRAELKWLGDALGDVRDAEVQEAALVTLLDEVGRADGPEELARAATLDRMRVRTEFSERYQAAHARCLEAMTSDRYFALLDAMERLVARPTWTPKAHQPIDDVVLRRVRHEWKRVMKRVPDADTDTGLHEVRKALKRFRYAVEPLRDLYGKDAKKLVRELKSIQDVLGAHHDSITLRGELVALAEAAAERGEASLVLGIAYAHEVEEARRLAAEFEVRWPAVAKKSRRRWLG
ncbi:MAG: CHAD domain-containing protein [Marmoricola sp.]